MSLLSPCHQRQTPFAVIMNMHYTGLGIARNLGEHRIPVLFLSTGDAGVGNSSKYGRVLFCPDSRTQPEELCDFLLALSSRLPAGSIIFPTRDADTLFLDRFRARLSPCYTIPQPESDVLLKTLDKSLLVREAEALGIPCPRTVRVDSEPSLVRVREEVVFPAVIKPVLSERWRHPAVWDRVGRVKAIKVNSFGELQRHYRRMRPYSPELLVQAWVPGDEDLLFIFGAYFTRESRCLASFTAQKRLQYPPGVGTGCLVAAVHQPTVASLGTRLLAGLGFSGIAEVEFKYDPVRNEYLLIEVNPRHWDQHRLGTACGVNISLVAYNDLRGHTPPPARQTKRTAFWVGEIELIRRLGLDVSERRVSLVSLLRQILSLLRARRVYGTLSFRDPRPFLALVRGALKGRSSPPTRPQSLGITAVS